MYSASDIAAVVVIYKPNIKELHINIDALSRQVQNIYLVINDEEDFEFDNTILRCALHKIYLGENLGLGYALNLACKMCQLDGYSLLLTLDQDTFIESNTVSTLLEIINSNNNIGIVGSDYGLSKKRKGKYSSCNWVITSGCLSVVRYINLCGGYEEKLFIDCIDMDIGLKLKLRGFDVIRCNEQLIRHHLGEIKNVKVFGKVISLVEHQPIRYYYSYRNQIYIFKTYWLHYAVMMLKMIGVNIVHIVKRLVFDKERMHIVKYIWMGIVDGMKGKYGKP